MVFASAAGPEGGGTVADEEDGETGLRNEGTEMRAWAALRIVRERTL